MHAFMDALVSPLLSCQLCVLSMGSATTSRATVMQLYARSLVLVAVTCLTQYRSTLVCDSSTICTDTLQVGLKYMPN